MARTPKDRFTKDEMLTELRTIFLFEADHIYAGAGPEVAAAFIGFALDDEPSRPNPLNIPDQPSSHCYLPPARVDLSRFPIAQQFEWGYDFAFQPSFLNGFEPADAQDLNVFMLGTPKAGGLGADGGDTHSFMSADGLCQMTSDAVLARWKLEYDPGGGHTFTTRELALLANMTEGAVRNALVDRGENGLKAIPGSKPVSVDHTEALRWLSGRRGFIASPERPSADRFLAEHLAELRSAEAFGALLHRQFRILSPSLDGLEMVVLNSWFAGSFTFDQKTAEQIARELDFDVPLFVGKALEVSLRRDAGASR